MSAFYGRTGCGCTSQWCGCWGSNYSTAVTTMACGRSYSSWPSAVLFERAVLRYPAEWLGEFRTALQGMAPRLTLLAASIWRPLVRFNVKQRRQQKRRRFIQRLRA